MGMGLECRTFSFIETEVCRGSFASNFEDEAKVPNIHKHNICNHRVKFTVKWDKKRRKT